MARFGVKIGVILWDVTLSPKGKFSLVRTMAMDIGSVSRRGTTWIRRVAG